MKHTLQIRNLILGDGTPRICVPIVASDRTGLEAALRSLKETPFDLAELRADHFTPLFDETASVREREALLHYILEESRRALSGKPLLFTVRTKPEGGAVQLSPDAYEALLLEAARSGLIDIVDMELFTAGARAETFTRRLQETGVKVIGSSHDFHRTPPADEMLERLLQMQALGMDISKLAVMPRCRQDVLNLLSVTCEMADGKGDRPFVTMSMGPLGMISRMCGALTGSAITFASAGTASAPGQIDAALMRQILDVSIGDVSK